MSIFHATALSKALREALDAITSDPYWIRINRFRGLFFATNARRYCLEQHAKCLELITAVDAFVSVWRHLETLDHSRYILKKDLATVLEEVREENKKIMLDLHELLRTSLHERGKVMSQDNYYRLRCTTCDQYHGFIGNGRKCSHHPFDLLFRPKLTHVNLLRIRYATSIARLLLVVFQFAEIYAGPSEITNDDTITMEREKQTEAIKELNESRFTLRYEEKKIVFGNTGKYNSFFDQMVVSDGPLPLTAFVSQHFESPDNHLSNHHTKSRPSAIGTLDQHPQEGKYRYTASGSGSGNLPKSFFGSENGPVFPFGSQPFNSQAPSQTGPHSPTGANFAKPTFRTDSSPASEIRGDMLGSRQTTSPLRQDLLRSSDLQSHLTTASTLHSEDPGSSYARQPAFQTHVASSLVPSDTQSTCTKTRSKTSYMKPDSTNPNNGSTADQGAPPSYTSSRDIKVEPQPDIKPTASTLDSDSQRTSGYQSTVQDDQTSDHP